MSEISKRFAKAAGQPWHEIVAKDEYTSTCACGEVIPFGQSLCRNLFYEGDARLVLEVMMQREDWPEFCEQIGHYDGKRGIERVTVDLMIDRTGKLATIAAEWMKRRKG